MPLFFLNFTILSNKTCILDLYQKHNFESAGVDTSGRVRHPSYSKKLFVRVVGTKPAYSGEIELHTVMDVCESRFYFKWIPHEKLLGILRVSNPATRKDLVKLNFTP